MSTLEKAKRRIASLPKDYTYTEAKQLLTHLGFEESNKGKTSGSRIKFYRSKDNKVILLHKPHPSDEMNIAAVKGLAVYLKEMGEI